MWLMRRHFRQIQTADLSAHHIPDPSAMTGHEDRSRDGRQIRTYPARTSQKAVSGPPRCLELAGRAVLTIYVGLRHWQRLERLNLKS